MPSFPITAKLRQSERPDSSLARGARLRLLAREERA
jgi:hypothetical protein